MDSAAGPAEELRWALPISYRRRWVAIFAAVAGGATTITLNHAAAQFSSHHHKLRSLGVTEIVVPCEVSRHALGVLPTCGTSSAAPAGRPAGGTSIPNGSSSSAGPAYPVCTRRFTGTIEFRYPRFIHGE